VLLYIVGLAMVAYGAMLAVAPRSHGSVLARLLRAYVLGWSAVVVGVGALSLISAVTRWSLFGVCLAVLLIGLLAHQFRKDTSTKTAEETMGEVARETLQPPAVRVLAALTGVAFGYVAALALFTPPNDWDGLTYHLTRAALWLQQGGVGYVPSGNESRLNGNPPVGEVGMLFSLGLEGGDRFAAIPQLVALAAAAAAVAGVARRVGLGRPESAFAGLAFLGLPIVLLQGQTIMVDLVVASFLLCATYFFFGERSDGPFAAASLALALGSKFTAILLLPVLLVVIVAGVPRARLGWVARWAFGGVVLGAPWYALNLAHTGHIDGGLADDADQLVTHTFAATISNFRAFADDIIDVSGSHGTRVVLYAVVGLAILIGGAIAGRRRGDRQLAIQCAVAGLIVIAAPFFLRQADGGVMRVYQKAWLLLGRRDIAFDDAGDWQASETADTSLSWFGPLGALALVGVLAIAPIAVRRRQLSRTGLALAAAPWLAILVLALMVVWDHWRGRMLIYPVGLAMVVWGLGLRSRTLAWVTIGLAAATMTVSLVDIYSKPSGLGLGEQPRHSIWHRDRIGALTAMRFYDGSDRLFRAVERVVPQDAKLAVAVPTDTFLSPFFGARYQRHVSLTEDRKSPVKDAEWLVTKKDAHPALCPGNWRVRAGNSGDGWRILERRKRNRPCRMNDASP
jgi:hypothetical protein